MGAPFRTASPPAITAPDHAGNKRPDAVYWTEPPTSLGALVSAWSNQNKDGYETPRSVRAMVVLLGVLGIMVFAVIYALYDWKGVPAAGLGVVIIALLVAAGVYESKSRPWCSFVGEDGFSEHRITWRRTEHTVVRFADVAGLWVSRTEHYTNGVYQKTTIEYEWRNKAGIRLALRQVTQYERGMAAAGARLGSGGKLMRNPTSELMLAAGARWRARRADQIQSELADTGAAVFPTRRGGFFTVRRGSVETDISGKPVTITSASVSSVKVDAGIVTIKTSSGKVRFAVSDVADHELALVLASELSGVSLV